MNTLKTELLAKFGLEQFVGKSPIFLRAIERIPLISETDSPVLLVGETGTGKEMVARALHYLGHRYAKPFVPINCGAIPEQLFESELFGHTKGAFTGVFDRHTGLVSEANGGTLFFDEINVLNLYSQVKLLRFLEDGKYKPLGASKYIDGDVRFIFATNMSLQKELKEGRFREDLYYRINVMTIELPALRERHEDVNALAVHFLEKYSSLAKRAGVYFSETALEKLSAYRWPGNVRELKNTIEKAIRMTRTDIINAEDLEINVDETAFTQGTLTFKEAKEIAMKTFEKEYLTKVLENNNWNISMAAKQASKDRRSFQRLIGKYGIRDAGFR